MVLELLTSLVITLQELRKRGRGRKLARLLP